MNLYAMFAYDKDTKDHYIMYIVEDDIYDAEETLIGMHPNLIVLNINEVDDDSECYEDHYTKCMEVWVW